MKKYNIIYLSMSRYSDWQKNGVVNRNFHILHGLAKSDRVSSIITADFFPFSWKRAVKTFLAEQLLRDRRGEVIFGDLTSRAWKVSGKITVYSTIDSVINPKKIIVELKDLVSRLGMNQNLIVINCNPLYTDYLGSLGQELTVFDAVDDWREHSAYRNRSEELNRNYQRILDSSDIFYTVSEELKGKFSSQKTRWLPNAVDFDHFQDKLPHKAIVGLKKPVLGFLGILQDRIDTELIASIAKNNPDKSIVLAGPVWKGFPEQQLKVFENIHFTGPVSYEDIPKMYAGFDVGMILYKNNAFIRSTNSMKYYEYLAAGLPVVSTYSGGIEKFSDVIYVANDAGEFNKKINQALSENSAEKTTRRKEFVKSMTWNSRIETMLADFDRLTGK